MGHHDETFEWHEFPEGRAQFSGSIRGDDERGHDTFAIELDGFVTYGGIDSVFLANDNDFNIRVVTTATGYERTLASSTMEAQGHTRKAPSLRRTCNACRRSWCV